MIGAAAARAAVAGVGESAAASRYCANAEVTHPELTDDSGQAGDCPGPAPVGYRPAVIEVQMPARPVVADQCRADWVLNQQRVQPGGSGGVIAFSGREKDRVELAAQNPQSIKVVMSDRSAAPSKVVLYRERPEGVGGVEPVRLAADAGGRVDKAHGQIGIARKIH